MSPSSHPVPERIDPSADPPPHAPVPGLGATAGAPSAARLSGLDDYGRAVMVRFLEALRASNTLSLTQQLGDPVAILAAGPDRTRPREDALEEMAATMARLPDALPSADALVDLARLQALPLGESGLASHASQRFDPRDLVVTVPIHPRAARALRVALGWSSNATLIVRPGPRPLIVAF